MNNRGPIITLFAVAALAAVLLVLNTTVASQTAGRATGTAPPVATSSPIAAPPPTTSPPIAAPPPATSAPIAAPEQASYAGRTSGNEATIAIAVRNGQAAAYLCDGRQVEAWLEGTITDGRLNLQGANGATATGTVEGNAIFGTVSVNGEQWPYSAQMANPPAGLYQGSGTVNGTPNRIGWIVLQDGSQVGIRNKNGVREPAPFLDPRAPSGVTVDGSRIEPQRVVGDTQVVRTVGEPPA
ncbi:MAG: hypothetical protein M3460_22210 [Actinomycetota bacterium]|nr:hypothetical protein [Actinomycetota bacterium]